MHKRQIEFSEPWFLLKFSIPPCLSAKNVVLAFRLLVRTSLQVPPLCCLDTKQRLFVCSFVHSCVRSFVSSFIRLFLKKSTSFRVILIIMRNVAWKCLRLTWQTLESRRRRRSGQTSCQDVRVIVQQPVIHLTTDTSPTWCVWSRRQKQHVT